MSTVIITVKNNIFEGVLTSFKVKTIYALLFIKPYFHKLKETQLQIKGFSNNPLNVKIGKKNSRGVLNTTMSGLLNKYFLDWPLIACIFI